jgi:hypothetical protein
MQLGFFDNLNPEIHSLSFNFMGLTQLPELPDAVAGSLTSLSYGVRAL